MNRSTPPTRLVLAVTLVLFVILELVFLNVSRENEEEAAAIAFTTLLAGMVVGAIVEFRVYWILRPQVDQSSVGYALKMKFLSLGARSVTISIVLLILTIALFWGRRILPFELRMSTYAAMMTATIMAWYWGVALYYSLRNSEWVQKWETHDARDRRQGRRDIVQNTREALQNLRDRRLDKKVEE